MTDRVTRLFSLSLIILVLASVSALPAAAADTVASVLGAKELRGATVAFAVWDLDTGEALYEQNIDRLMTPASNMKVITAAATLLRLGTDFQFTTSFFASNAQDGGGTVENLYVKGDGDPTFSGEFFDSNAAAADALAGLLKRRGVQRVTGDIIVDAGTFYGPEYPSGWAGDDASYCYGMRIGALSIGENCLAVTATGAGKAGSAVTLKFDPPLISSLVSNQVKTVGKGKSGIRVSQNSKGIITVSGQVRAGASASSELPVSQPDMVFGAALGTALQRAGIPFNGRVMRAGDWHGNAVQWTPVASVGSPPLLSILGVMLKNSDNFIAEMLIRTMGYKYGAGGTTADGARTITDTLAQAGVTAPGTLSVYDGSGLSRSNRLTPRVLLQVFRSFYNSYLGPGLRAALAEPGQKGTMKKRLTGTGAEGAVWAKTGALRGVCALSGYFKRKNGHTGAFVMIMNGYSVHSNAIRSIQDKLVLIMLNM